MTDAQANAAAMQAAIIAAREHGGGIIHFPPGRTVYDPSGLLHAQAAHDAGAVRPPAPLPTRRVVLEFRVLANEAEARALVDGLTDTLLAHPLTVGPLTVTETELD